MELLTFGVLLGYFLVIILFFSYKKRRWPKTSEIYHLSFYGATIFGAFSSLLNLANLMPPIFPELQESEEVILFITLMIMIFISLREMDQILKFTSPLSSLFKKRGKK
jgi:amino acid transporter